MPAQPLTGRRCDLDVAHEFQPRPRLPVRVRPGEVQEFLEGVDQGPLTRRRDDVGEAQVLVPLASGPTW